MSESAHNPFEPANLSIPALDDIIRAVSVRPGQTEQDLRLRAAHVLTQIMAFAPRDVAEITLAGQTVLFNAVSADRAGDVMAGMLEKDKQRAIGGLINMGRMVLNNLDRMEKRGNRPHRAEPAATRTENTAPPAEVASTEAPKEPTHAEAMPGHEPEARPLLETPAPDADAKPLKQTHAEADLPYPAPWRRNDETSWLDEPFEQWLIETPADLARRAGIHPDQARVLVDETAED